MQFAGAKFPLKQWHTFSSDHSTVKMAMVKKIIELLKTRRPNATEDWHHKLPHMARRLEDALYHDANSYEEYADFDSLLNRLQKLALAMSGISSVGLAGTKRVHQQLSTNVGC
jgi:peptide subunit release factor 1 (eRF1)